MKGLFQLRSPRDLLAKLKHDFHRLQQDNLDVYAAFDFFVSARHLPEWLYPEDKGKVRTLFESDTLLRVCRHLAEGSKHFEATDPRHNSVSDTSSEPPAFQQSAFQSSAFQTTGKLIVELKGDAQAELGPSIEVTDLAARILKFWEEHPDLK